MLPDVLGTYPGFLPGLLVAFAFSIWASEMVGRWLKVRRILAWLLVMGFGAVLAATLTPGRESLDFGFSPGGICDLRRMRPAMTALLSINYSSLNVLLLVPLGVAIGLLPRSGKKVGVVLLAVGMVFAVETVQALLPVLGRRCESGDVIDNLTGLLFGLVIGTVVGILIPTLAREPEDDGPPADDAGQGRA